LKVRAIVFLACFFLATAPARADDPTSPPLTSPRPRFDLQLDKAPASVAELRALQARVKKVLEKVVPCTVGLQIGGASGSGVLVDKEGRILTAGHVSGRPDRDATVIFHDGKRAKGKTLGKNDGIDSGMLQITDKGNWPFVELGSSRDLKKGQWCVAVGHPGGYQPGRAPVVRVGRILEVNRYLIVTDNTLVGGDSGGPLFDLDGKVIGIHGRIGPTITANIHVPVDTYRETWDRLAKGESWGGFALSSSASAPGYLGVQGDVNDDECRVTDVTKGSPAEKAGIKADDVITKFDGKTVGNLEELADLVKKKRPGAEVQLELVRGGETVALKVKIGRKET
jgi:serine protease Do